MAANRASQVLKKATAEWGAQKTLAEKTGISSSWLSRLADGAVPESRAQALTLKRELGIEVEWWDEPPLDERTATPDPAQSPDAA